MQEVNVGTYDPHTSVSAQDRKPKVAFGVGAHSPPDTIGGGAGEGGGGGGGGNGGSGGG